MTAPRPGITRRSTLSAAGIALAGAVAGFVVARNSDAARARGRTTAANAYGRVPAGGGRPLAAVAAIPDGGGLIRRSPAVVLVRAGSRVHAFSAVCPHQGCLVDRVTAASIDCPCHGSRFATATGAVLAGPATRPLTRVPVTVRNGEVFAG
jgi:nitrite reductase/ring-hydroxylating ferredoxin subunit